MSVLIHTVKLLQADVVSHKLHKSLHGKHQHWRQVADTLLIYITRWSSTNSPPGGAVVRCRLWIHPPTFCYYWVASRTTSVQRVIILSANNGRRKFPSCMVTYIDKWRRKFPSCMVVKGLRGSQQTFNELIYFPMHKKQATQNHEDFSLGIRKSIQI